MAGPGQTKPGGRKGHATGKIWYQSKEGGEASHQPEHSILPSNREVHGIPMIASRSTRDMGRNVERAGPAWTNKKHQVLVAQIQQEHGVSPCRISHTPPLIRDILERGLQ